MIEKNYLPHIDILRALAVSLVILHHIPIFNLTGGYIGVDIFFVISGYLITKHIISHHNEKYFIGDFYKSRIIRLAPALFTVLFFSVIIFSFILTPDEILAFYQSIIYANFFSINIYIWKELDGYFTINSANTPLMHLWSLAVEEQFYITWPIILVFILKFKKYSKITIFLLIIFFLFISEIVATGNSNAAYFLTQYRAFEFIIGASIFFIPQKIYSNYIINTILIITVFIIIFCAINFDRNTIFPGINAFIPCLAATLYIYFGYQNSSNILKYNIVLELGKISYPAYLWHWPLIVFLNLLSIKITWLIALVLITITLFLSKLTYQFIEIPSKKLKSENFSKVFKNIFLFPSLLLILISLVYTGIINMKYPDLDNNSNKDTLDRKISLLQSVKCIDSGAITPSPLENCYLGISFNKNVDFLLIGDSHANAQSPIIDEFAKNLGLKGHQITQSSTIFLPDIDRTGIKEDQYKNYIDFRKRNTLIKEKIKNGHYKYIIMGGFFPDAAKRSNYVKDNEPETSEKVFLKGIYSAIKLIIDSGSIPVIIQDNPLLQDIDVNCILRPRASLEQCQFDYPTDNNALSKWNSQLNQLEKSFPQLIVIDFTSIICNKEYCQSSLGGVPLYRDSQHLTYEGARMIGKQYLVKFGNPLQK